MLGLKMTGKVPFTEVYCHSLIRDSEGRKMSKSLGNVIDPVDIMEGITLQDLHDKLLQGNLDPKEVKTATKYQKDSFPQGIPECGADALRFSLIQYTTGGGDIAFDVKVMQGYRRFCNKIYQATKYVLGNLPKDFVPQAKGGKTGKESLPERWILHKFTTAAKQINEALDAREFSRSTSLAYAYWYDNLCDVYIENSKAIIRDGTEEEKRSAIDTLYTVLEGALCLIHPFMPFLTEELWQRLPRRPEDKTKSIVVAAYPEFDASLEDFESEAAYELLLGCSKGVRSLMSEYSIKEEGKGKLRKQLSIIHDHELTEIYSLRPMLRRKDLQGRRRRTSIHRLPLRQGPHQPQHPRPQRRNPHRLRRLRRLLIRRRLPRSRRPRRRRRRNHPRPAEASQGRRGRNQAAQDPRRRGLCRQGLALCARGREDQIAGFDG